MEDVGVAGPPCRLQLYPDSTRQARASEKPAQSNKTDFFLGVRWHLVGRSPTQEGQNQGLVAKSCGGASVRRPVWHGSFGQTSVCQFRSEKKQAKTT